MWVQPRFASDLFASEIVLSGGVVLTCDGGPSSSPLIAFEGLLPPEVEQLGRFFLERKRKVAAPSRLSAGSGAQSFRRLDVLLSGVHSR